jgi:hypothetical protein
MTADSDQHTEVSPACAAWLDAHPEWAQVPGARYYEASHRGNGIRSLDRTVSGRRLRGKVLSTAPGSSGYPKAKITRDDGAIITGYVHGFVLAAHAGPCPDGLETLHGKGGPLDSRYCGCPAAECTEGNLRYGSHEANVGETIAAGNARRPAAYPCINHERCGGMVVNPGRRCLPCAMEVGKQAAAMLRAGLVLDEVTRRLGYQSRPWMEKLARDYGGFTGPLPQARPQPRARRQPWPQRVMATLRYRLRIGRSNGK